MLANDAQAYTNIIHSVNKDYESSSLGDILDLAEKFHVLVPKEEGWSVDDRGCSCPTCYKHVHRCHTHLLGMVQDARVKAPKEREIAEPSVRKGLVMGRSKAGQKRKLLLAAITADRKKNVLRSRALCSGLHVDRQRVKFPTLVSFSIPWLN